VILLGETMPYIKPENRTKYQTLINDLVTTLTETDENSVKGELNYFICSTIKRYLMIKGFNYARANDIIGGTLTMAQHELNRRLVDPYEDQKQMQNGDF
jgi:hypothetical protein